METAIKKAIEGGYTIRDIVLKDGELFAFAKFDSTDVYNKCLLDPLFWQALGKACGWGKKDEETMHLINLSGGVGKNMGHKHFEWSNQWHRFLDHLAEGKSPDEFF